MRLVLFQPDIPQNTGTLLRLAACFGVPIDLIEPFGFIFDGHRLRRSGMDYIEKADVVRHKSWPFYQAGLNRGRLVLVTTKAESRLDQFAFKPDDRLLMGRESCGVPAQVHEVADASVLVPMRQGMRSLNVALAAAIVLAEALRQTGGFPAGELPTGQSSEQVYMMRLKKEGG